jgi:iron complex outermembrane recepter protein
MVVVVAGGPAYAQTAAPDSGVGPANDTVPAAELAPVVVEVFRTPVALDRAPYGASVVERGERRGAQPGLALDEALRGVPGVQVDNRYIYALGERISIRGFGARAQFGVRGIRVLVDGVPATFADGQSALEIIDPSMVGSAEVIRGAASALYGNAAGGVVSFPSARPAEGALEQRYRVLGGAHDTRRVEASAGGRRGGLDFRGAISYLDWGGFREHSDASSLRASAAVGVPVAGGALRITAASLDFDARNPGALPEDVWREDRSRASPMNVVRGAGKEGWQRQAGVAWAGSFAGGEAEAALYGIGRWVRNPIVPLVVDLDRRAGGLRTLYRRPLAPGWTASAALDLEMQRDDRQNYQNADGEPGNLVRDQLERVSAIAPSVQLLARPADRLDLMAAVRYDRFGFRVDDRLAEPGRIDDGGDRVMSALSPSAGALLRVAPGAALFANVSTAFETPTTTELANRPDGAGGFNPDLEPQRTTSLEAGARIARGAVGGELTLYRASVENSLIPFEVPDAPGRTYFRNAGSALHRGAEAAAWVRPVRSLELRASYTNTDARFRSYTVGGSSFDGNRVPGVAPHRLDASVEWRGPGGLEIGTEVRRVASVPTDDANSREAPPHLLLGATARHTGIRRGAVSIRPHLSLENVLDRAWVAAVVPNATAAAGQPRPFFEPGPGRSLFLGVEVVIGGS